MAGIIAAAQAAPAAPAPTAAAPAGPSSNISDPLLNKTKIGIEAKVGAAIKDQFLRIEIAGLALLTHGDMPQMVLQKIKSNPDTVGVISDGVANVVAMVFNQVESKIPQPQRAQFTSGFIAAAPAAGIAIMCQALDMAEQGTQIKVTPDLIAACTKATGDKVLAKLHISPARVQQAVAAGKQAKGA